MNYHCGWDVVVMACHRHSRGISFVKFGTSGLGKEFIGANKDQSNSPTGKAVFNVFSSYVRGELFVFFCLTLLQKLSFGRIYPSLLFQ